MRKLFVFLLPIFCLALISCGTNHAQDELQFNRDIRPILSSACFRCHGFDAKKREGNLRLDEPSGAFDKRGDEPPAIVPGNVEASLLIQRILATDAEEVMPPPSAKRQLSNEEKEILKRWVAQGAKYQLHWAFEGIGQPAPPANPEPQEIDRFLAVSMDKVGLKFQPQADRGTLIRRVAFTLTGLPPTPSEVIAFQSDDSPQAYERMVDRYLTSKTYGEEMAKHWLDVARYGDTHGLHLDNDRQIWAYRDWVVQAFNQNLPFSQFTIEQLAGDLLPNPTQSQLVATGFNRCNVTTSEGGAIDEEFLYRYAVDRASTTIQTWLGLTGGCAVCHDHKFDPLTMKDYYSMYSFFYSAADPAMDGNIENTTPYHLLPTPEQEAELNRLRGLGDRLKKELLATAEKQPAAKAIAPSNSTWIDVWMDDDFPIAAGLRNTSRNSAKWSCDEATPFAPAVHDAPRGKRSLYQAFGDKYEQVITNGLVPRIIPLQPKFQAWVKLDAHQPPSAIFVELRADKTQRWIWTDDPELSKRVDGNPAQVVGPLPKNGSWQQLTIDLGGIFAEGSDVQEIKLGLFGGVCSWDSMQCIGSAPAANDVRTDFQRWWSSRKDKDTPVAEGEVAQALKAGPESDLGKQHAAKVKAFYSAMIDPNPAIEIDQIRQRWYNVKNDLAILESKIPGTFIFKDRQEPRQAFVMNRGQYDQKGDAVQPTTPQFLPKLAVKPDARPNRLDLARWLVSDEQPLTARVTVNRFWQQVFGLGLVKTSEDFGTQGATPSHPELLDFLASRFRSQGWNVKQLMKEMLMTRAFQQVSVVTPEGIERDPENRWLARGPRLRLDAEQIRDNALATSGLLVRTLGGPGTKGYQPPNIWEPVGYGDSNTRYYVQEHGESLYRRSLYSYIKRTAPPPFMSNFDAPNREMFCARRERSNTPLQALQLMNDVQHFEAARKLAERLIREGGSTASQRVTYAYLLVLSRYPDAKELELTTKVLGTFLDRYQESEADAKRVLKVGESPADASMNATELAAYSLLANLMFNLDETVNRN